MKVSVLTSIPWLDPSSSQTRAYREAIEQVRFAEELGYDCFWFTEHHFGTHGINSSILSWAAYVAGITRRIRIGTAVVVAPLYQPVRLAEEIAQVDLVSDGRLELGIGSGYRFDEFRGLNISPEDSRPMFMEVLEILFKAWTGEPFSHTGKYYSVPEGISVRPTPLQKPHPPLWFPALSPKTIEWVVKMGSRLMTATTGALSVNDLVRMRETFNQLLDQAEQRSNDAELYIHVPIHVTEKSFAGIEATLGGPCRRFGEAASSGGTIYQQSSAGPQGPLSPGEGFSFKDYFETHAIMGTPQFCVDKIADWWQRLQFTHLTCMFNFGLPHALVMEQMESFARNVIPSIRDLDTRHHVK
jgi:alkanesulfonate monooxygenase SsuD/methylene tetrahydromethanopterin reductase-like flavin-dependent oxidoreductase (luciferase family)